MNEEVIFNEKVAWVNLDSVTTESHGALFTKFFFSRAFFLWKFLEDFINGVEVESLQILNNSFHFPTRQLIPNNPF